MKKKEIKNQNHISLDKFLRNYVGIDNEDHIAYLSSLSHKKLKEECRARAQTHLVPVSFDDIEFSDIAVGEVLLVKDAYHKSGAYLNIYTVSLIETEPFTGPFYDPVISYEEYIDEIENHLYDEGFSNAKIKSIGSYTKNKGVKK